MKRITIALIALAACTAQPAHAAPTPWHSWFAWHPVRTDKGWRWLTTVVRRGHLEHSFGVYWWEYKA